MAAQAATNAAYNARSLSAMERALRNRNFPNMVSKLMFAWVAADAAMTEVRR
jgi:hypothetical protein